MLANRSFKMSATPRGCQRCFGDREIKALSYTPLNIPLPAPCFLPNNFRSFFCFCFFFFCDVGYFLHIPPDFESFLFSRLLCHLSSCCFPVGQAQSQLTIYTCLGHLPPVYNVCTYINTILENNILEENKTQVSANQTNRILPSLFPKLLGIFEVDFLKGSDNLCIMLVCKAKNNETSRGSICNTNNQYYK